MAHRTCKLTSINVAKRAACAYLGHGQADADFVSLQVPRSVQARVPQLRVDLCALTAQPHVAEVAWSQGQLVEGGAPDALLEPEDSSSEEDDGAEGLNAWLGGGDPNGVEVLEWEWEDAEE
ncbi:hypothetical protein D9Q98_002555 [Chlorella vulgaris]|uniref:Uncharacterized protein n=1 Tax=Chlorella vulgaris TaxID=3077 RepID=A0A9D4TTF9_CHLVU|nr:hypothetical protein D9Q98_002555 [Chlorella vulgaris]